jgi:hypothetical protein
VRYRTTVSLAHAALSHPDKKCPLTYVLISKIGTVSSVLLAIELKAAMTEFQKAMPRLKDKLTSSFQTIHGDSEHAIVPDWQW